MDKYQQAIVEYDAARKQIIQLTDQIGNSIGSVVKGNYTTACTCGITSDHPLDDTDCIMLLYKWNRDYQSYREVREDSGENLMGPLDPDMPPKPVLCEAGKLTDKLIQDRKAAKQRFGIAKRRLSSLARGLAENSTQYPQIVVDQ
jgi:hypothetical protein